MRRHLEWLVKLCLICRAMEIIKTHGEMLSKETIFQLQRHPAAKRDDGDAIKNTSKICCILNDSQDGAGLEALEVNNSNGHGSATILNVFREMWQQIQKLECKEEKAQQRERASGGSEYEVQESFNILQQLRLDEQKQKLQQQFKLQQQQFQQQQEDNGALELQNTKQHFSGGHSGKADKKKKKKRRRKRKRKRKRRKKKRRLKDKNKKPMKQTTSLLPQPAHILFASAAQKPQQTNNDHYHQQQVTTKKPYTPYMPHPLVPTNKIKYILHKGSIFKKKKQEYLNHLKHVLYPFIKFIVFFTIINPFTVAVFLFSLISPLVFGVLGFAGLSFFIKPALSLLFGVKHTVDAIARKKLQELRRRKRLRDSRRPITIHKHYYLQKPIKPPPAAAAAAPVRAPHRHNPISFSLKPKRPHILPLGSRHRHASRPQLLSPLLPGVRHKLKKDIKGHSDSFERFLERVH